MPAKKYIQLGATGLEEKLATQVSSGVGNGGDLAALDDNGKLDLSLMPSGIGPATKVMTASEALTAGNLVNVWNDAGVAKVRRADAATNKPANGFVLAGVASGATVPVYFEGEITGLSGLIAGNVWLSASVPGGVQAAIPTTAGHIAQRIGVATSATTIDFEPGDPITRA